MLVLSRKEGQRIVIGDGVVIEVIDVARNHVKLGITAPRDVRVDREEVARKREQENERV